MTVNLAIVGTGIFAHSEHLPAIQKVSGLKISACYNRTKSKSLEFATKANLCPQSVFDDLDSLLMDPSVTAIDALLPAPCNLEIVEKAIAHRKPIAIEKPIAGNLQDARQIVSLAKSTEIPVLVLENFVYHSGVKKLKELLPRIGDVITYIYQATGPYNDTNKYLATSWRQNPKHIGGYLSDGGVHQLAVLTEVLGSVSTVVASAKQARESSGTFDTLNSLLTMTSGVTGSFLYTSALGATEKRNVFSIFGSKGSLIYDFSSREDAFIDLQEGENLTSASSRHRISLSPNKHNGVFDEFENFRQAIQAKDKSLLAVKPEAAFHHLAIVDAALKASSSGLRVKVERP